VQPDLVTVYPCVSRAWNSGGDFSAAYFSCFVSFPLLFLDYSRLIRLAPFFILSPTQITVSFVSSLPNDPLIADVTGMALGFFSPNQHSASKAGL